MAKLGSLAGGEELLYRLPEEKRRLEHVAYGRKASHDQSRVPIVRQGIAGRLGTASAEITGIQIEGIEEIQVEESATCVAFADVLHMDPTMAAGSGSIIRGHAPRNRRRSHAKLCEQRLLHRLCASLGRLSWADARKHAATLLAMDATATPNSANIVSCAVSVPVLGGYPSWADAREHRGQRASTRSATLTAE